MKLAELDWGEVMRTLPRWEALSPAARRAFLQIRPGVAAEPGVLGEALDEMVAAGVVARPGPKGRMYPHAPELRPLLVVLRAMDRSRPLEGPGGRLLDAYLQDQLSTDETAALSPEQTFRYWVDRAATAAMVSSVAWIRGFLAAESPGDAVRWEQARMTRGDPARLAFPAVARALRQLVQALTAHPAGVPLRTLADLLPGVGPEYRHAALAAGLRYLLVFVSVSDGPDALLGVLPCIARRLGPPPPEPAALAPAAVFEAPFHVADLTAVLVEAATEPIPMRGSDGGLYVRAQKALAERLLKLPAWANGFILPSPYGADDEDDDEGSPPGAAAARIGMAVAALKVHRFAAVRHTGERYQLAPTPAGRAWLALSEGERLKALLDGWRASPQRNPGGLSAEAARSDFFGLRLPFSMDGSKLDLRASLTAAFLSAPAGGMAAAEAFLRYQSEVRSPFTGPETEKLRTQSAYSGAPRTLEGWESVWAQILLGFLRYRLVALGGASLGQTPAGIAFALTDVGRYLLGASAEFRHAAPAEGEVLVQPDFEIVFLAAAPRVEAELARFAERTGTGVGALFRITKASVLRAAEQGLTADAMLKTLGGASRTGVPANVARQVRDWFGSTRRVRIRPAVLVECPDTETAARVTGLAGGRITPVTRTILRLDGDQKSAAALVKKLRAKGIFVQE